MKLLRSLWKKYSEPIRFVAMNFLVTAGVVFSFYLLANILIGGSKRIFGTNIYGGYLFMAIIIGVGIYCSMKGDGNESS